MGKVYIFLVADLRKLCQELVRVSSATMLIRCLLLETAKPDLASADGHHVGIKHDIVEVENEFSFGERA